MKASTRGTAGNRFILEDECHLGSEPDFGLRMETDEFEREICGRNAGNLKSSDNVGEIVSKL
jgi:hypothetical protein